MMSDEERRIIYGYGHLVQNFVCYDEAVNLCRTAEWWRRLAIAIILKCEEQERNSAGMRDA